MVGQSNSKHNQIFPDININTCTIRNDITIYIIQEKGHWKIRSEMC